MVEVPDALRTLFTATLEERDGRCVVSVPRDEVEHGAVSPGTVYRVALLSQAGADDADDAPERSRAASSPSVRPPVEEGEVRTVAVETTGDQGDGIAKVERGYVVIVPGAEPGDEVEVELVTVHENFAIADPLE